MTIKKQYVEIIEFLEANKNKKVSSILEEIYSMASAKTMSSTSYYKDDQLVAIFCYYHKRWELITNHSYGTKKSSKTGLNSMCKEGVNQWTKQQKLMKLKQANLLNLVSTGELKVEDIPQAQQEIEETAKQIVFSDNYDFETSAEDLKDLI